MLIGHIAVSLPYVILVLIARLQGQDLTVEEAATSLGASKFYVFRRVTLPLLLPGVVAALLFAFTVSFDNFVISYFLAPPGVSTLPVEIYSAIRAGFTPEVNAVSTIIFALSMGVLVLASRFTRFV
jgi:spermidine/putrescine transport system permease protein